MKSSNISKSIQLLAYAAAVAGLACTFDVAAQDAPRPTLRPYPTSAQIASLPLTTEKRAILEQLFLPEIPAQALKDRTQKLCPHALTQQAPVDDSTKKGIADVSTSIITELHFRREGEKSNLELGEFSMIVELTPSKVFLQHHFPRFPSDAAGVNVPVAGQTTRPVRLEGKFGADILALVPPLRDCGVQSVALCPRRYTKNDELLRAPYVVQAIRPLVTMKADGVFAPPSGTSGKVMTSLLASTGVALPHTWFLATSGSGTLSQAIEFETLRDKKNTTQSPLHASTLPAHLAIESRVDLGREEGSVRTVSRRTSVELSSVTIPQLPNLEVGTSELTIEGGQCYLLSTWNEEVM